MISTWTGVLTDRALMEYQQSVWTDRKIAGYDELLDFTALSRIDVTTEGLRDLAQLAREMDEFTGDARVAVVTGSTVAYGMARMYEAFRESAAGRKHIRIFRDVNAARSWLGI